jgi:hypothetical protein
LAGCNQTHDRWNGRAGDLDYQTSILRLAGERGMVRRERLFLTQNTLPVFDRLLDLLEEIPCEVRDRYVCLLFYAGLATRYEDERITEEIRDKLPERIRGLRFWRAQDWRPEREWIPLIQETASLPRRLVKKIDVNESNIERLESLACDTISADLERRYRDEYRQVPGLDELFDRYGDLGGSKIYMLSRDLEQKWMDMHERETGIKAPPD